MALKGECMPNLAIKVNLPSCPEELMKSILEWMLSHPEEVKQWRDHLVTKQQTTWGEIDIVFDPYGRD